MKNRVGALPKESKYPYLSFTKFSVNSQLNTPPVPIYDHKKISRRPQALRKRRGKTDSFLKSEKIAFSQ